MARNRKLELERSIERLEADLRTYVYSADERIWISSFINEKKQELERIKLDLANKQAQKGGAQAVKA